MDRLDQYKHKSDGMATLMERKRGEDVALRKDKRDKIISSKRFRLAEGEDISEGISIEEVTAATTQLQKHGPHRIQNLKTLRQAFAQGTVYIDAFFNVENALNCLVGLLIGLDTELQLEASWCVTNISAGTHEHTIAIVKSAAPYLITYLSSSSPQLQDQCAWSIGNLAGDSKECRDLLHMQGVVLPLVQLLQSPSTAVVHSAAFAISNMARESSEISRDIVKAEALPNLSIYLAKTDNRDVLCEVAWALTYLSTREDNVEELVAHGMLKQVVELLVCLAGNHTHDAQLVTPLLRCLGNVCSGPDKYCLQAWSNPGLLQALESYLSSTHRHIRKETLWVLSNITGEQSICRDISSSSLIPIIIVQLDSAFDIKMEALYLLCNLACHGESICEQLLQSEALQQVIPALKSSDAELLGTALAFCEMILRLTQTGKEVFDNSDGVARLEGLEYHANQTIRQQANQLLDGYFLIDEGES